jgi:endo-1,4-beta-xylanase
MGTRRTPERVALALGAGIVLTLVCGRAGLAATEAASGGRAAPAPHRLGTALNTSQIGTRYTAVLERDFTSITPEYEMEMDHVEPAPGRFTFAASDRLVGFARSHGLAVRGHALVWYQQVPAWVRAHRWTRPQLAAVLRRYIAAVVGRYRGRVREWDVVNEPLTSSGALRRSVWERAIGPGYLRLAFLAAQRADPGATLFLNEYGAEFRDRKERALYGLVRRLRATGVPVEGVGFQAHLSITDSPTFGEMTAVLRRFAALGVRIEVTELDVDASGPGPLAQRLRAQARVYRIVGRACRAVPACGRITTWGITDPQSWLGRDARALPFDARYRPKPAWTALVGSS